MTGSEDTQPEWIDVAVAAQEIWRLFQQNKGATFSLYHGNLAGQDLYAVSIYRGRELVSLVPISVEQIEAYLRSNLDLLSDSENSAGIWLEAGENFYDVVLTVKNHQEAIRLAQTHDQLAICHLTDLTIEYIAQV